MTAVDEPRARDSAPARAWRSFRQWRRGRPFWGGLVTIVAGLFYYFSVHLNPTSINVSFGQNGYLAWLIPLILVLCGLLAWLSPAQRIFYGIVAAATAVYGLIAVNLGGFFVGMLVGIVGGSLVAAWSPRTPTAPPAAPGDPVDAGPTADAGPAADPTVAGSTGGAGPAESASASADELSWLSAEQPESNTTTAELPSGPLSDELPPAQTDPVRSARHAVEEKPAAPVPRQWRHRGRGATLVLVPAMLMALGLLAAPRAPSAYADTVPCTTATPTGKATSAPATKPVTPSGAPASSAVPAPSSAAPAAPASGGSQSNPITNILNGIADGLTKLLGGGSGTPAATPSTAPSRSATPSPVTSSAKARVKASTPVPKKTTATPKKPGTTCPSSSAAPANAKIMAVDPGQPPVAAAAVLKTAQLDMSGLSYDGVVDLPLKNGGTIQVLKFSMSQAVNTPFELDVPVASGQQVVQTSSKLTISGHVEFYCTRFVGWLGLGPINLIKLTFTPDAPPPLVLSSMTFGNAEIQLVYVHADQLVAKDFNNVSPA